MSVAPAEESVGVKIGFLGTVVLYALQKKSAV